MGAFVCLLIVLVLGSGGRPVLLVRVVRIVDVFATVQAGHHIAAGGDDATALALGLARRNLTVALDSGVILAGLRLGRFLRSRFFGGKHPLSVALMRKISLICRFCAATHLASPLR